MTEYEKIHELTKELIPFHDELSPNSLHIVNEHINICSECKRLFENYQDIVQADIENEIVQQPLNEIQFEGDSFKKIVVFKRLLFIALLIARVVILALLSRNWIENYEKIQLPLFTADLIVYYFPFVALIDSVMFIAYRKLWFWLILLLDILILMFFDNIMNYFM